MYWEGAAVQTRVTDKREGAGKTFRKNQRKAIERSGRHQANRTRAEVEIWKAEVWLQQWWSSASCLLRVERVDRQHLINTWSINPSKPSWSDNETLHHIWQISRKSLQQLDACGRYSTRDCSGYEKIVLISDQVGAHLIFVISFDSWDFGTKLQNIQDILGMTPPNSFHIHQKDFQ